MFNLNPSPTFPAPVQLTVPGEPDAKSVDFTFRHKSKDALAKWWAGYIQSPNVATLAEIIEGWALRRDGEAVQYTVAALDELCQSYPAAMGEVADAYMLELIRSKRKN